jgi:hypothetical protein
MPGPSMTGAAARPVAAPTRFELALFALTGRRGLHSPTGPCAHRHIGGVPTRAPQGRPPRTPPGGRTLTTRLRAWHASHYVRGVRWGRQDSHLCVTRRPLYRRLPSLLGHTPMTAAGVAARCQGSWHLCTGGWSLRGDVRGTCPRSPCTVPAMCTDVSPSAVSSLTAPAVPAPGRKVVSWPAAPALAGDPGGRIGHRVERRGGCLGPHAEEPPPAGGGGSSADPRCFRVSYEGRPRGACSRSVPRKA